MDNLFSGSKENNKINIFCIVLFILFFAYSVVLFVYHEPWRDEVQSWLLARDLNILNLLAQLRYDGHPFAWFALLFPFAKAGLPFIAERIVHFSLLMGCGFIICFKFKLNIIFKFMLLFATPLAFELNALSRNYLFSVFILLLMTILFSQRFEKHRFSYPILLFVLINTNLYASIIGIALYFSELFASLIIRDSLKKIMLLTISFIAGMAVFAITLFTPLFSKFLLSQPVEYSHYYYIQNYQLSLERIIDAIKRTGFYSLFNAPKEFGQGTGSLIAVVFVLAALCLTILAASNAKSLRTRIFVFLLGFAAFFGTILAGSITDILRLRHCCPLIFTFVFMFLVGSHEEHEYGLIKNTSRNFKVLSGVICFAVMTCTVFFNFNSVKTDFFHTYSYASEVGAFLKSNGYDDENTLILAAHEPQTSTVLGFSNHDSFRYVVGDRSFVFWQEYDSPYERSLSIDKLIQDSVSEFPNKTILFLDCKALNNTDLNKYQLIYSSSGDPIVKDESYLIYKIK